MGRTGIVGNSQWKDIYDLVVGGWLHKISNISNQIEPNPGWSVCTAIYSKFETKPKVYLL